MGAAVQALARAVPAGWLIEAAAVLSLIFQRRLVDAIRAVMGALGKGDLSAARNALAALAGHDTRGLDEVAVARGAVESAATRFSDGVVGAAFWYLLLGLPGLCIFRTANVIAARIGHPTPRHAAFGATAARIDDVLALLPAASWCWRRCSSPPPAHLARRPAGSGIWDPARLPAAAAAVVPSPARWDWRRAMPGPSRGALVPPRVTSAGRC